MFACSLPLAISGWSTFYYLAVLASRLFSARDCCPYYWRRLNSAHHFCRDGLYKATQYVQAGDFSHRVKVVSPRSARCAGESFNLMTDSINKFIEDQKQHQRLENEISHRARSAKSIVSARLPLLPGVQLEAICKAARMVSGDYYDFIQLNATTNRYRRR